MLCSIHEELQSLLALSYYLSVQQSGIGLKVEAEELMKHMETSFREQMLGRDRGRSVVFKLPLKF